MRSIINFVVGLATLFGMFFGWKMLIAYTFAQPIMNSVQPELFFTSPSVLQIFGG